jgi:cob(I)alamin adenosyltransferase|tara:strand:- start:3192 stop:3731 length:540 start_codon:yes stop_codon:yes gene_type:complete
MSISTKTGDNGETSLFNGNRISKSSCNIDSFGSVDELNSMLGLIQSKTFSEKLKNEITIIQNELFVVGADLATPENTRETKRVQEKHLVRIDNKVDEYEEQLELTGFVLPTGTEIASLLHIARTQARRAERKIVQLAENEEINPLLIKYLNRLSDLFYLLALNENKQSGKPEKEVNFDI